jgi:hypothetical protein
MIRFGSGQGRVSSRLWFLLVLTVLTVAACGAGTGDGSSRAATPDLLTVDVYSGRENPTVDVDPDVFAELETLATSGEGTPLTVADVESAVPGLGFRGYTAEVAGGDLTVRLLPGVLSSRTTALSRRSRARELPRCSRRSPMPSRTR